MTRRLLAMVGIVAMLIAFAPGLVEGAGDSGLPSCCDGVMCPMHKVVNGRVLCGMMTLQQQPGSSFQSCPDLAHKFTGALPFLRVAPASVTAVWRVAPFVPAALPPVTSVTSDVPCPPPRSSSL